MLYQRMSTLEMVHVYLALVQLREEGRSKPEADVGPLPPRQEFGVSMAHRHPQNSSNTAPGSRP